MSTMTKYAVVCLYFLHHTHSLLSSCLLFTETKKPKKSKSPLSDPTTFFNVPPAPAEELDIIDDDYPSEAEQDQAGFAQGHSQSQKVACKEPRVQVQKLGPPLSGKERAARLRKQQQLAQSQEDLAPKCKRKSQTQDDLDESPRSTTHHLSAFRDSKE
jgi:hypothetical protein